MTEAALTRTTNNPDAQFIDGMTVNERLFHFGLFDEFDSAVRSGELLAIVRVLCNAKLSELQAHETATAILAFPARYGF